GGIVLHPVGAEFEPIRGIARLIVADEIADDFGLARFGEWLSLGEILVGAFQESAIEARRNLAVGSASAIDQLLGLAVLASDDARVERMRVMKIFQVGEGQSFIESVGARQDDVLAGARALGRKHGLEIGVEKRSAKIGELVVQLLGRGERREIGVRRLECALFLGSERGFLKLLEGERRKEFLRGFLVVIAAI